jgi:F0F1-type ATP synthase assembly protein I
VSTRNRDGKRQTSAQWLKLAAAGTEMAAAIFICVFIGNFIDKRLENATPWMTILMLFIGVAAAFYLVYKQLK